MTSIRSPLQAQIVQWQVMPGDAVQTGDLLVILEAMKMEHELRAEQAGCIGELFFAKGDVVAEGDLLLNLTVQSIKICRPETDLIKNEPLTAVLPVSGPSTGHALRPDLQKMLDRQSFTHDVRRPEAVAKRHALGLRTARENIADL
ncbi:MAG: acetyl-CoA carboxylase biotin carboxyl carrier protein subunit, partial [Rhodoferax sp.]|nr:acetyl-CoA carboxylase biotin carboxyl carrier protein subunit [Rhodoferax sp.]